VRHPTELVQYNPNAGNTLSARRPTKPTFQEPTNELEYDDEEDEEEDDEEGSEGYSEEEEDDFDEGEDEDEALNPIAALRKRLATGDRNMASNRNLDDTQMKAEAARRQMEQRRQQQREQMPPPNAAARPSGPKLSMRKANAPAPQITYGGNHPSESNVEEELRDSMRALHMETPAGSSMNQRPSFVPNGGIKATSYSHPIATENARITVESINRNRRNSYMGSESRAGLEAMHARFPSSEEPLFRNPQQYPRATAPPHDFSKIIEKAVRDKLNELQLPSGQGAHSKMDLNAQMMAALAYQSRADQTAPRTRDELGDLPNAPLTASALRRKTGQASHTGSSRSKRSSDDGSRISTGHRITTGSESGAFTVNGDEMKVRIDTTNGFEMEFEGRRVMLQPVGDGSTADLIIGGKRETAYFSSKGSTATRSQVGSRLTRAPSQRDRDVREREPRERDTRDRDIREREQRDRDREQRERRERRERNRPRYDDDDDDDEEDRRTARGGAGRRRADTYDSEYARTGQMRRQDRYAPQNDYPPTPAYSRPQYGGPAMSGGYNGYPPQPYPPSQADHVWGAWQTPFVFTLFTLAYFWGIIWSFAEHFVIYPISSLLLPAGKKSYTLFASFKFRKVLLCRFGGVGNLGLFFPKGLHKLAVGTRELLLLFCLWIVSVFLFCCMLRSKLMSTMMTMMRWWHGRTWKNLGLNSVGQCEWFDERGQLILYDVMIFLQEKA
jgi:hypothetical protein